MELLRGDDITVAGHYSRFFRALRPTGLTGTVKCRAHRVCLA
jgi:hypothetical protein